MIRSSIYLNLLMLGGSSMKKIIFVLLVLSSPSLIGMEQIVMSGRRSPRAPRTFDVPPNFSLGPSALSTETPHNSPTLNSYSYSEAVHRVVVSDGNVPESVSNPSSMCQPEDEVKKECTKFKLALLAAGSALVSSGITAAITYMQSKC